MWLRSSSVYKKLADYDLSTKKYRIVSLDDLPDSVQIRISGSFEILSSTFLAFYSAKRQVFLHVGEECFPVTDDVIATVSGPSEKRVLTIQRSGKEIAKINYALDPSRVFENDPTPFIEPEDFDYGLFLANVTGNAERKKRYLE